MSIAAKSRYAYQLVQHLGLSWVVFRIWYALKLRVGVLQAKLPNASWNSYSLSSYLQSSELAEGSDYLAYRKTDAPPFFFSCIDRAKYQSYLRIWDENLAEVETRLSVQGPIELSNDLRKGKYRYFSHLEVESKFPPNWHTNPLTSETSPTEQHWSKISDFDAGDIKLIWEPNRFSSAYTLVRAYWRTGDHEYAELFWQLFEDWYVQNPPLQGVNWKCGQEISFRVMAWCFALYGFIDSHTTSPERVTKLVQAIALSGERIALNFDYALSQRNNHGISEALGLWTIGTLFPELKLAHKWSAVGRHELERQARELIYSDGAFSQQSVNYHRVMLHDYLWVLQLGKIVNQPFSFELHQIVAKAAEFLSQLQDSKTGKMPCYGANDGACVLPLNNCDYSDFRPIIQALYYLAHEQRCFPEGLYDEDLLWIFGLKSFQSVIRSVEKKDFQADTSGYYILRSNDSTLMTRAAKFKDRPSDADLLHVDFWWKGQNIAIDPGTYSYNALPPWDVGLKQTEYHNTVTVDGYDQMKRVGKFLWLPWAKGVKRHAYKSDSGNLIYWEGSHNGYESLRKPVSYCRGILKCEKDTWLIVDHLSGNNPHQFRLHWLLHNHNYIWDKDRQSLKLNTAYGDYHIVLGASMEITTDIVVADKNSPRGWCSKYYSECKPAISLSAQSNASQITFFTLLSPYEAELIIRQSQVEFKSHSISKVLRLGKASQGPLIILNQ